MLNGDPIELFETVYRSQRFPIRLEDTEPLGAIGGIRLLVDSGRNLVLNDLADLVVESSRNRNVSLDPGNMGDDGHDNRREEIFSELASLAVVPCKSLLIDHHEVVE